MSGSAALQSERFRDVIGHFASGVTVITTELDGEPLGTTASAVSSLSLEPPMLLACLKSDSATRAAVAATGRFAVNILNDRQAALATRFATKGPDKFDGVEVLTGRTGLPLLAGALAHLECAVAEEVVGGTHSVFLGEALAAVAADGRPLAYFRGGFGRLHEPGGESEEGERPGERPEEVTVRSAQDCRLAIEIGAATLAAALGPPVAALHELNDRLAGRFGGGGATLGEWLEEEGRFHERIVALAGSDDLVQAHRRARAHRAMAAMAAGERGARPVDPGLVATACAGHRSILESLESGDTAALVAAMRHHDDPVADRAPSGE